MMETRLIALGEGVVFAAIVFVLMWVAKAVADRRVRGRFDPNAAIEQGANLAVGLRRAGLYLGMAVGLLGALSGGAGAFWTDVGVLWLEGAVLVVLLMLALEATDRVVVHGIANDDAVRDGNVAVGAVEFGAALATGMIARGSFSGEGGGLVSAIVFFVLGQLALLALAVVYERMTPFTVIDQIRRGNVAAGGMLSGMLVAFGFILNASLTGPALGWKEDLAGFATSAVAGIGLLLLFQWPIDKVFLPGLSLRQGIEADRNVAAIAVAVAVKIALALVIAAVVI